MFKKNNKAILNILIYLVLLITFGILIKSLSGRMHQALIYGFIITFSMLIVIGVISKLRNSDLLYNIVLVIKSIIIIILTVYDILISTRFYERFDSLEELKLFINSYGGVSKLILVIAQALQVTLIPIPSSISIIAGDELFGLGWTYILCLMGVMLGSILAFSIGRVFGTRFANWMLGQKSLCKYHEIVKGKDKIILSLMFIFPFFPDDLLCIVAGISSMSFGGFILVMLVSRSISIMGTLLIKRGLLIVAPFSGWGIVIWISFLIIIIGSMIFGVKNSERIEKYVTQLSLRIKTNKYYIRLDNRLRKFIRKKPKVIYEDIIYPD